MFAVIYSFQIKPDHENEFLDAWKGLTSLIYEYEGSLGSRLHKEKDDHYIAYAQWPDKSTWKNSGGNLPESANLVRLQMKNSCEKIETLFELDMVEDLLKEETKRNP